MLTHDFIELKAYWGNDGADSSIKISAKKWEKIKAGAQYQKTAKSYYEGQSYDVTWSFLDGTVSIDGEDGMQCVAGLPLEELILRQLKTGEKR
jgi:hypothetical protein